MNGTASTIDNSLDQVALLALLFSLLLSVLVISLGAHGVRGTDQYNYLADTNTVLAGREPVTNLLFPAKLIREGDNPTPASFHHNGPPIYVAAFLGKWLGAYNGWVVMNLVSHLVVAVCLWLLLMQHTGQRTAMWVCSFYLLSPSAIWLGINVLQEMFFAALVALVLVGFAHRLRTWGLLIALFAVFVGVLSHPLFVPVALLFAIYLVVEAVVERRLVSRQVAAAIFVSLVSFYLLTLKSVIFPSSFQPDLAAIISSAIPGESNMFWHYSLEQREVSAQLLLNKLLAAAQRHFLSPIEAPFYVYTNLAVISLVYLSWRHLRSVWQVLLPLCVFLGLYASMIVLQQNQPRYQQIVAVASFVMIALAWHRSGLRLPNYLLVIVLLGNAVIGGYLAYSARKDAVHEHVQLAELSNEFVKLGLKQNSRVVSLDLSPHSPLASTVRPGKLLSIRTNMMTKESIEVALARFQPTYLILDRTSSVALDISKLPTVNATVLAELNDTFFGNIVVSEVISDR